MKDEYERAVTWVVATVFVASLLGVGYVATTPGGTTDAYTELYVLGAHGNASNYSANLSVGEMGAVTVGVGNHEHRRTAYTVVVELENRTAASRTVTIDGGDTWEEEFSFTPTSAGDERLRIRLYRGNHTTPPEGAYRTLRVWVHVSDRPTLTVDRGLSDRPRR